MRYAFVARERTCFPVRVLCRVLSVSVSGFHDYLHRQDRPDPEAALRADLHTIHAGSRRTYGRPRMVKALRACAHAVGHKRVARLIREEGLRGKAKGRFTPRTTDSQHARPVAENLLDRRFAMDSPVPAWVGDITYIPTREGWLYLATAQSHDPGAFVDRTTIGETTGLTRAVPTASLGMTKMVAQAQLSRVAIHGGVADLATLEQCQAAAYLVRTVLLPQSSNQLQAHRLG